MTAKEYLLQARSIKIKLEAMAEQLEFLRSAAECVSPSISDMPKSGTRNIHKNEDAIIRVLDFEERMKETQKVLLDISNTIGMLTDPLQQSVVVKRYLGNKPWPEISVEMCYGTTRIYEIHREALENVEIILKERSKV